MFKKLILLFSVSVLGLSILPTAFADAPFVKTFTISAYYSPLPCQNRYSTGSYEGDIRLNGRGTNGADGTQVYPGMVAAPKSYAFGTKLNIPGIGTVAVHDRGGAIVTNSGANGVYDRLDIWMGWGDEGLKRALNWGKRNVDVTVYGVDNSIIENISLEGFSLDESISSCSAPSVSAPTPTPVPVPVPQVDAIIEIPAYELPVVKNVPDQTVLDVFLPEELSSKDDVLALQHELSSLNFYKAEFTGEFDELTSHALFKFQQSQFLVADMSSAGAGLYGPKTRDKLNEILASREYNEVLIAEANIDTIMIASADADLIDDALDARKVLSSELGFGAVSPDVVVLQEFLRAEGYMDSTILTNYYGPLTRQSVIHFQLANNIILSVDDIGAGRIGPATLKYINSII